MAEHDVTVTQFPAVPIGNADVIFQVNADGERFGHLTVSKGGVDWQPANATKPRKMRWEDFARIIAEAWA